MIRRPFGGRSPTLLSLVSAAGFVAGCSPLAGPEACPPCGDPDSPTVRRAYARALRDAERPRPREVSGDLVALEPANQELEWNDGQVLMVTWTEARYYRDPEVHVPGRSFRLAVDTWLTPAPFVQRFCRALELDEPQLVLRLEQRLGLPPERGKDRFLEIWVDPRDLFRPCPDPEVTDRRCRLDVHGDGGGRRVARRRRLPRACDPRRWRPGEKPADPEHLRWLCANWNNSFGDDEIYANYPWTALGYTYDWGDPDDPRGVSEFVAPKGTTVVFHELTPTAKYCS